MYIKSIKIENFRNYTREEIYFDKNLNIITGSNAQGKTSLLEGVYLCSFGKSFRTSRDREMINFDNDFFRINSCFVKDEEENIDFILSRSEKKSIKINGIKVDKISDIISDYFVVIFSPEDLKIVKDNPEKRRNFIDRELCQMKVAYYNSLLNYKKLLKQRNFYLKESSIDMNMLDVWDNHIAREGSKIIHFRKEFLDKLGKISSKIHGSITDFREIPNLNYISSVNYKEDIEIQEKIFYETLLSERERDMYYKNTSIGPHKDDMDIMIDGISIRKYGSQGQQRTATLSLKLAEIEIIRDENKENPILLLDDVLSELDESRQIFLLEYLNDIQVLITAAEIPENLLNKFPNHKNIIIKNGKVEK